MFDWIGGMNFSLMRRAFGALRYFAYGYMVGFFMLAFMPIFILIWASLLPFYTTPSFAALDNVTFNHYADLFSSSMFRRSFVNTAIVVLAGATLTMVIIFLISYVIVSSV